MDDKQPWRQFAPCDQHSRIFSELHVDGTFYCHATLGAPWDLEMPAVAHGVSFHLLTEGTAWIHLDGEDPVPASPGEFVLVPHGRGHRFSHDKVPGPSRRVTDLPQTYLTDRYSVLGYGGAGATTRAICGIVSFPGPMAPRLLEQLPVVLTVAEKRPDSSETTPLRTVLTLLSEELARPSIGADTVAARLADVAVTLTVRFWLEAQDSPTGWFRAVTDPQLGPALVSIHDHPAEAWTVESLARRSAMSRSAFAALFTGVLGKPPLEYLTEWRMSVAAERLRQGATVASVALEVGYASESAFNRAFQRVTGQRPGQVKNS